MPMVQGTMPCRCHRAASNSYVLMLLRLCLLSGLRVNVSVSKSAFPDVTVLRFVNATHVQATLVLTAPSPFQQTAMGLHPN